MSDDTPATGVDPQDPLPESSWLWRRIFTFIFSLISVAFIWYGLEALWNLREAALIYSITRYMIGVLVMLITYYMVAPSAEQSIRLVQSAKLLRSGIPLLSRRDSTPPPDPEVPSPPPASPEPPEDDFAPRSRS